MNVTLYWCNVAVRDAERPSSTGQIVLVFRYNLRLLPAQLIASLLSSCIFYHIGVFCQGWLNTYDLVLYWTSGPVTKTIGWSRPLVLSLIGSMEAIASVHVPRARNVEIWYLGRRILIAKRHYRGRRLLFVETTKSRRHMLL